MKTKISIISPARDETQNLPIFVEKIRKLFSKNLTGELIIVNDASSDGTDGVLKKLQKKYTFLKVLTNRKREGMTRSFNKGYKISKEDIIIFTDCDLETDPEEDIPKLIESIKKGNDIVLGNRINKRHGIIKTIISYFFNLLCRLLFRVKAYDLGWIKAYRRYVLEDTETLRSDWHRYLPLFAVSKGYKLKNIDVKYYPRKYGKSKFGRFGFGRLIGGFFDLLAVKFLISFSDRPMFVFGFLGLLFSLAGFIGGIYLVIMQQLTGTIAGRPLLFLVVLLIILGIQFFALGFLAESLSSIREELKKSKNL